ncbi:MAG TPA: hypothetical protein VGF24_34545 [Vicinamibacterales bacterium]|jgi:hypothetical protein
MMLHDGATVRTIPVLSQEDFRAGDWVEVRSKEEILRTLDERGELESMPFMPEMFAFCGQRLRVYKRAHKTCDTVNDYKGRKLKDAVHLEGTRCDGRSHGGCEAGCLLFWKTAWLKPVSPDVAKPIESAPYDSPPRCTEGVVLAATRRPESSETTPAYRCQATQVPAATAPLGPWETRQYFEDYRSGNVGVGQILSGFIYMAYRHWLINLGIGIGPPLRWLYDRFQAVVGGVPYPRRHGTLPLGSKTPVSALDLQPGEWVRVKDRDSILATCDEGDFNRGMKFDAELVPYCGGRYRVLKRVTKILNEKTGVMQHMKTPCIILDSVVCQARYSECRLFCPRAVYSYWREIWLERDESPQSSAAGRR